MKELNRDGDMGWDVPESSELDVKRPVCVIERSGKVVIHDDAELGVLEDVYAFPALEAECCCCEES